MQIAAIALFVATATAKPEQRERTCVPVPVMLSFRAKTSLPIERNACWTTPPGETVLDRKHVDPAYIDPFFDVMGYRKSHISATAVDDNLSRVDAFFAKYGRFVLVSLANHYMLRDAHGVPSLGCGGVEYYRVDPRSAKVLAFDQCVESHKRVLPALSQLPQ